MPDPRLDVTAAVTSAEPLGDRARVLLVVYPGEPGAPTTVLELADGAEVVFGRSRTSTVAVDHERVSRQHARIVRRGGRIVVDDLGSRNGTRVNGARIEGPVVVTSGDVIAVGPALAVLGVTGGGAPAPVGGTADLDDRLAAEVDRAGRYRRPLALLMVRIDGDDACRDDAEAALGAALRRMDALAEYLPGEFAVVAPELSAGEAAALGARLAEAVRGAGATARLGIASYGADGTAADELIAQARGALRRARAGTPAPPAAPGGPVIVDPRSRALDELIDRVAGTAMTVLVLGETGVGKELVAEALHRRSARAGGPLVRLNCAALPESLLESELFGHERGAFTGADRRREGFFEAADGGTLLLDEIGELPLALQPKLLRALEQRRIVRVGGTAEVAVDVRLVAATHRDLELEVRAGRFREDLWFRLGAFTLAVPPLRDRPADILPLAERFAATFSAELGQAVPELGDALRRSLLAYPWPGNVRELRNAIERACVMHDGGALLPEHLPERVRAAGPPRPAAPTGDGVAVREHLAEVEKATIVAALEATGGNQTRAAARLGLSRRALIYKLEKHGLKPPPAR